MYKGLQAAALNPEVRSMLSLATNFSYYLFPLTLKVKMASRPQSLETLLRKTSLEDHEEVLQACNAVLKQSKKDVTAQHVKAVALLKLDKYDDALRVLEDGGATLKNGAQLETAYALYKTGKLDEARNVAQSITNDRGARHVEAQAVCVHHFFFSTSLD